MLARSTASALRVRQGRREPPQPQHAAHHHHAQRNRERARRRLRHHARAERRGAVDALDRPGSAAASVSCPCAEKEENATNDRELVPMRRTPALPGPRGSGSLARVTATSRTPTPARASISHACTFNASSEDRCLSPRRSAQCSRRRCSVQQHPSDNTRGGRRSTSRRRFLPDRAL